MPQCCVHLIVAAVGVLWVVAPAPMLAADPTAEVVEFGRYKCKIEALAPTAEATSGAVLVESTDEVHLEATRKIPCNVGESFGFRLRFKNLPVNRAYVLREVTTHPPITQPDGKVLTESVVETTIHPGKAPDGLWLWHFQDEFRNELVPGKWTHTVYVDGAEIASMTFDVVK